jgi:predicted esterase
MTASILNLIETEKAALPSNSYGDISLVGFSQGAAAVVAV